MEHWRLLYKLLISNTTYLSQQLGLKQSLGHWLEMLENEIEINISLITGYEAITNGKGKF